jgi:hypothetical protein
MAKIAKRPETGDHFRHVGANINIMNIRVVVEDIWMSRIVHIFKRDGVCLRHQSPLSATKVASKIIEGKGPGGSVILIIGHEKFSFRFLIL